MRARAPIGLTLGGVVLSLLTTAASAQVRDAQEWLERCRAGEPREHFCEVREFALAADGRELTVDGRPNGGITVTGWDRDEILVQALVSVEAPTPEEARADVRAIQIHTDAANVRAEGLEPGRNRWWSVSYRVYTPRGTDLRLHALNGGLQVENVSGRLELGTTNGGIVLRQVAGDVRGWTTNGGLAVRLDGPRWQGTGLDLRTTNGGILLHVPDGYSAQLETGTVNGQIDAGPPLTARGRIERELSVQLGEGGSPIRLHTTNGWVQVGR